jgi:MFS transporter, DHA2 family, multidrug resistance protein
MAEEPEIWKPKFNPWLIAVVVSLAAFMEILDTSIANVALPHLAGDLGASNDESTWVLTSYLVSNAIVLPISGWLASLFGRKRFFLVCIFMFTLSSLLCGAATSLGMLILFRIIQGLGGGGLQPMAQAILADTFPPQKRGLAFALYGITAITAPTIGPTLGGWITDNYSWHWIFFINIPFGIISLSLVQWLLVEPEALKRERREQLRGGLKVDWLGFVLVALFLGCLEIVLDRGQEDDWFGSGFIVTFTLISAVSFALFLPWEWTRKDPVVDVRLLFTRQFGTAFLVMLSVGAILFGSTQILPQLLQTSFDYSAYLAGLALMPGGLAMLLMMPAAGALSNWVQPKYLIAIGMAAIAFAMWHMTGLNADVGFSFFAWARVLQMIGLPLLFIPINTAAYADLPPQKTNQASALINVARNLGGSIGISLANTEIAQQSQVHQTYLVAHVAPSSPAYQETVRQVTAYFVAHGQPAARAAQMAISWIGQMVAQQATLLAYIDVFWLAAAFTALMAPLALLLLRPVDSRAAPAVH